MNLSPVNSVDLVEELLDNNASGQSKALIWELGILF